MVKSQSLSGKLVTWASTLILALITAVCLLPIVHTVAMSFSDKAAAMAGMVNLWPVNFTLSAYYAVLEDKQFFQSFYVSVKRVLLGGGINLVLTILTAFPLSRSKQAFPQRNIYMWYLVFTMLFSGGLIPSYLLIHELKLLDTLWALVLPGAVPIFNVIILMNFFKGLPDELEEAARIDGASVWRIMLGIFVPLSVSSIATVTLFSIVGHWNAFFDGIIYMNKFENRPLQSYLQQLVVEIRDTSTMSIEEIQRMQELTSRNFNAAKVFVSMVPILAIYPFLQKYFVTGLVLGAVKG